MGIMLIILIIVAVVVVVVVVRRRRTHTRIYSVRLRLRLVASGDRMQVVVGHPRWVLWDRAVVLVTAAQRARSSLLSLYKLTRMVVSKAHRICI